MPTPFAALLTSLMANRTNMNIATNPNARWLFPGRRTGAHLHVSTLGASVRDHGIPVLGARTAALRQLVLQAPAPVVAQALGYHATTAPRHADDVGSTWSRYVAGGHSAPACNRRLATEDP